MKKFPKIATKKVIVFILLSCLVVGVAGASTYAYLTDNKNATNELGLIRVSSHIDEEFPDPPDPKPGTTIVKKPRVVSDSDVDVYVRMRADFSDSDAKNQCLPLDIDGNWTKGADGYYYYNNVVQPGGSTSYLFQYVRIKDDVKAEDIIPFDIICYCECVQAHGFKSATEAWNSLK